MRLTNQGFLFMTRHLCLIWTREVPAACVSLWPGSLQSGLLTISHVICVRGWLYIGIYMSQKGLHCRHQKGCCPPWFWLFVPEGACVGMPGMALSANGACSPASLPGIPCHSDQKIFLKFSLLMTSLLYLWQGTPSSWWCLCIEPEGETWGVRLLYFLLILKKPYTQLPFATVSCLYLFSHWVGKLNCLLQLNRHCRAGVSTRC